MTEPRWSKQGRLRLLAMAGRLADRDERGMIGQVTTVVAVHAHPDDEVLLTSLARTWP